MAAMKVPTDQDLVDFVTREARLIDQHLRIHGQHELDQAVIQ